MNIQENLKIIVVTIVLLVGLAACNKPGPAERAGKNIDSSINQVGQKIDQTVDKIGEKMTEQGTNAGTAIDDTEITAKVKAAIFAESGLKTLQISVDTKNGVVTLSGTVTSQSNSNMAKALAGAISGVKSVDNKLAIKPKH